MRPAGVGVKTALLQRNAPALRGDGDEFLWHDRKISKCGNRYLRALFVQAAWVVLIKPKSWERYGLKPWIEAAKRRLHYNVLAIALANKLARIAWSVLARGRGFEARSIATAQPV